MTETLEKKIFLIRPVRNCPPEIDAAVDAYIAKTEAHGHKVYNPQEHTPQNDPIGLNICRTNRQAIIDSDEVHVYWTAGSTGTKFDLGMAFMANKPIKFVNSRDYVRAPQDSFENFLLELDIEYYLPHEEIQRPVNDNSFYLVCPSQGLTVSEQSAIQDAAFMFDSSNHRVYYPPRDTPKSLVGVDYFSARRKAMQKAGECRVYWACDVTIDNFFELGMAFMEEKSGKPVHTIGVPPPPTDGQKSFNNVLRALNEIYKKPQ